MTFNFVRGVIGGRDLWQLGGCDLSVSYGIFTLHCAVTVLFDESINIV